MKRNIILVVISLLAIILMGQKPTDKIGYGTFKNGVYTNEHFGMRVNVPEDWYVVDDASKKEIMKTGKKMMVGNDKNLEAAVDASSLNTINLLTIMRYPPGIKTGKDFLYHVKQAVKQTQMKFNIAEGIYSKKNGEVSFDVQEIEISMGNRQIQQKYYATIIKGYALCIILTSDT